MAAQVFLNGRAFDWESVSVKIVTYRGIIDALNIKSVDWSDTRGVTPTYGAGGAPRGYGRRNYRAQGSIEIADETYAELIQHAAGVGGFYNLTFNVNLIYGDNPFSAGYGERQTVTMTKCIPARRGGASRQGVSEARIARIEFEALGGITELGGLSELAKVFG